MKGKGFFSHKVFRIGAVSLLIFAAVAALEIAGVFSYLEYKAYDARVLLFAGSTRPSEDIVLILLDQNSLDWAQQTRGWGWPWPRSAYGEITRFMQAGGARAVVFDVMFTEPSVYGPEDDAAFASASEDFGKLVQTLFFSSSVAAETSWSGYAPRPGFSIRGYEPSDEVMTGALFPVPELSRTASSMGSIRAKRDSDDVIRRNSLFVEFDGEIVPAISLSALAVGEGMENPELVWDKSGRMVSLGRYTIPVKDGNALVRFRGNLERYIPYNAEQILRSCDALLAGEEPLLYPEDFADKYVFFGFYAPGLFDMFTTPISSVYPGVGMHITMLDNILQNDFIRESPAAVVFVMILLCSVIGCAVVFAQDSNVRSVAGLIGTLVLLAAAACAGYAGGVWVPVVSPLAALALGFFVSILIRYNTEGRQKRYLKAAFQQYLSPVVIDELISHPDRLKLGGERREISIFFSDLQGFTSISERLSPEDLTELLNEYLSAMTDIILDSGGTIDKYEGDAIIAFWNAPTDQPDHALRALQATIACQRRLEELRPYFREKTGAELLMRIGLNTGFAVVGNMGSSKRFDYTMLGDSVNLAARLEGLNKQFGTYTMCTRATRDAALQPGIGDADSLRFRELSRVAVVGKKEAVTVFEPMLPDEYEGRKDLLAGFDAGRELFYAGDFSAALASFEALGERDPAAVHYAEKCRELLRYPPDQWQGVWQAVSK
ncbi:MAG: adenylate/guanylate cyclase domain-containing protein [Spirochaetaceae bacterium]|jgi:adenylate cyclase|nr:adenylate/guanylate cyclase domain-containing protein [Spirochaetaceae bacterium]